MALYLVFDVESVGLHGEGFAVGGVIIDHTGQEFDSFEYGCDPNDAKGEVEDRKWVLANCHWRENCDTPRLVRDRFWKHWDSARDAGITLVADCPWPVEATFLNACIADDPTRAGKGPYPFLDVATVVHQCGGDPTGTFSRRENELPEHSPLADARQSARIFTSSEED